jgi:flagellar FliL protein
MAKKKKGDDADDGKSKKKILVPVILLVAGLFAGKTFFGGGAAAKTPAEIAAEEAVATAELLKECQEANGIEPTDTPATETSTGEMTDHESAGTDVTRVALIVATRPQSVRPSEGAAASTMGSVLEMDAVTVNLADAHYLKLGLALQLKVGLTAEAAQTEGLGAKALDMALERLSANEMRDLISAESRAEIKQQLGLDVCLAYEGEVTTVYFTEFVMQ